MKPIHVLEWRGKKEFFSKDQHACLIDAIKIAERETSGEIRLYVESECPYQEPVERAKEIFFKLKMQESEEHNASLIYVAVKHKQAAVYGDTGIHQKVGEKYWKEILENMFLHFRENRIFEGICLGIADLGLALMSYFPFDKEKYKNGLPDEIVFGK